MTLEELLNLPEHCQKLEAMPEDSEGSVNFSLQTDNAMGVIQVEPMCASCAMPFENPQAVIDAIHEQGEDQALIEVDSGVTKNGDRFIYSITKNLLKPEGEQPFVQYFTLMHLQTGEQTLNIQIFLDEIGTVGRRDAAIYELMKQTGEVGNASDPYANWYYDPYDPEYKRDFLMNRAEARNFDKLFPTHPLSQARLIVERIVGKA